jgi:thymidylate synthase (FAD)
LKIINAGYEILTPVDRAEILQSIEKAGRTCYKSEDMLTETSASAFTRMLIKRGHEAMIEHCGITVKFICDRGVSHEIVRHRIASYAQESTRYCNYGKKKFGKECTFIRPIFWEEDSPQYARWKNACELAEKAYFNLLELGASPQEARSVLPNSLKTEIIVTMNMRAWRNFFTLRTADAAHPQIREIAQPLLAELKEKLPEIFEELNETKQKSGFDHTSKSASKPGGERV